ncbi:MAG: PAS domain S-box protein [Gammaproteobacteria bacterium]|nr:PAS domain S-box protein [Gammaproteobacteria bacterium]
MTLSTALLVAQVLPGLGCRPLWFLPAGIAIGFILRWGSIQGLPVLASQMVLELLRGRKAIPALLVAVGLPAGAALMRWLLVRMRVNFDFSRRRDAPLFIVAGLGAMVVPATIGAVTLATYYPFDPADSLRWSAVDGLRWWLNDAAGALVFGPIMLAWGTGFERRLTGQARMVTWSLAATVLLATATLTVSAPIADYVLLHASIMALSVMLVTATAAFLGFVPATVIVAAIATVDSVAYSLSLGAFSTLQAFSGLNLLWELIGAMVTAMLVVVPLLAEQDRALAALRSSEQRFTTLFRSAALPIFLTQGPDHRIVDINDAVTSGYGYTSAELLGRTALEVGLARDSAQRQRIHEKFLRTGALREEERTLYTKHGQHRTVLVNAAHVLLGDVEHALTTVMDVTERRRVEQQLFESEQQYVAIFRHAAVPATLTTAPAYTFVDVNDAWTRTFGFTRDELIGKTITQVGISRNSGERDALIARIDRDGQVVGHERVLYTKDGLRRTFIANITRFELGGRGYAISTLMDITDRKQLEAAVTAEMSRTRAFLLNASDAVHILDEGGRIVEVSASGCRWLDYSRDELLGQCPSFWEADPTRPAMSHAVERVLRGFPERFETTHRRKDGSTFEVEVHASAFTVDDRKYIYCSMRDLTEIRQLERAMLDASDRERNRLGMELHDGLGQELTGVSLLFQSLVTAERNAGRGADPRFAQIADLMRQVIATCRTVAHGLAPVSSSGGQLVDALRELVRAQQQSHSVDIRFGDDVDPGLAISNRFADELYRIAQEALTNALRHAGAREIYIGIASRATGITLTIADNGCGLSSENRPCGLGLRSMRFRARSIGAQLTIEPRPVRGTRVVCHVPRH